MKWYNDITIGDLHYLRSKFVLSQGLDAIYISSLLKATEAFYYNKQFAVCGDNFLTWAYLRPEYEIDYIIGKFNWLDDIRNGKLWIVEAYIPNKALNAYKNLKYLAKNQSIRMLNNGYIRRLSS